MDKTFDLLNSDLDSEHKGSPLSMVILYGNAPDLPFHERVLHLFISFFFEPLGQSILRCDASIIDYTPLPSRQQNKFANFGFQGSDQDCKGQY